MLNVISYTKRTGCFEQSVSFKVKVLNYNSSTLKGDIINLFYTLYDKCSAYFIFVYIAIGLCIIKSCIGSKKKSKSIKHLKDKSINNDEDGINNDDIEEVNADFNDNINEISIDFDKLESGKFLNNDIKNSDLISLKQTMKKSNNNKSTLRIDKSIDNNIKLNRV
jgi:hypothetical protein